jgi:hypothetical protein
MYDDDLSIPRKQGIEEVDYYVMAPNSPGSSIELSPSSLSLSFSSPLFPLHLIFFPSPLPAPPSSLHPFDSSSKRAEFISILLSYTSATIII